MRPLRAAAYTTAGLNALGLVLAAGAMRPGAPMMPLDARVAFLASRPIGWTVGWGVWMLAAIALVVFFVLLARAVPGRSSRAGLVLVAIGAAVDLACDTAQMTLVPLVAAAHEPARFAALDRACWAGGVIGGSGLYCLAVATLTIALARAGRAGPLVVASGALTLAFGAVWVGAEVVEARAFLEPATAATVGAFLLWAVAVPAGLTDRRR